MKTKSSNSHKDSKKVRPMVNSEKKKTTANLQGRNSSDGRERSYERDTEEEEPVTKWNEKGKNKSEKNVTRKIDQKDIKKEFEIRSGKESEEHSDTDDEKREKDEEKDEKLKEKELSWQKSYKGDAEIVI